MRSAPAGAYARRSPMTRACPPGRNWPGSPRRRRTPIISPPRRFLGRSLRCSRAPRLDAFLSVYVEGFLNLAEALRARRSDVSLFYPSSVAVAERPRGMLEYAMAKAAGETLCAEINQALRPLHVTVDRLPRLLTDQTASVIGASAPSPVDHMLAVVRETQSWPRQAERASAPAGPLQTGLVG